MLRFFLVCVAAWTVHPAFAAKTLVYCSEASPSSFNPQQATDGASFNASSRMIFNRLVEFKPGTTEIIPSLAEKWDVFDQGKIYRFHLRKGVSFHQREGFTPSRTLTSEDVKFTFEKMLKKDHPYHLVGGGTYEYFQSMGLDRLIKEIRTKDELTVEFVLHRPDAPFLANMAMDFASVLSQEYAGFLAKKNAKEKFDLEPVGTGPFVLNKYVRDSQIRYTTHAQYFAGKRSFDQVVFAITPDPSVRSQKLKAGECDLIAEPSPQDIGVLKKLPSIQVVSGAGLNVGYLAMNTEKPPLDKLEVRQAIHHALNRRSYIQAIYVGQAQLAKNPIPPTMWSYNEQVRDLEYDLEKSRQLLKKAGMQKGFELELWTLPVSRPYNPNGKKMGEMMQADLAKVGIKVRLVTYDWSTYLAKARLGEHQLIQVGWTGDNGDPDNFLNNLLGCDAVAGGSNYARWCHKPYNDLLIKARSTADLKKRTEYYRKAQLLFKEQAPWVTLAHATVYRAMSSQVLGYKLNPLGTENFDLLDKK